MKFRYFIDMGLDMTDSHLTSLSPGSHERVRRKAFKDPLPFPLNSRSRGLVATISPASAWLLDSQIGLFHCNP